MLAALLIASFLTAAAFALYALSATWRQYGTMAMGLRAELKECGETRPFGWSRTELTVTRGAAVVRLPVKPVGRPLEHGWRAAA